MLRRMWIGGTLAAVLVAARGGLPCRHATAQDDAVLQPLVELLAHSDDPALQRDVLRGMLEALRGRQRVPMPAGWAAAYARLQASGDEQLRATATTLAVVFGDAQAIATLRRRLADAGAPLELRAAALHTLVQQRVDGTAADLHRLVADRRLRGSPLRGAAVRGLASFDDPRTAEVLLQQYGELTEDERRDAVATLAVRKDTARQLLQAVEQGRVPRTDLSAFVVRQLSAIGDEQLSAQVARVWGTVRPTSADKQRHIARYKQQLTAEALARGDRVAGRGVYHRACANCHRLFDAGGEVGPNLTGAQRTNLDYLLENLLDPSAVVGRDYQMTVVQTVDGRILSGIVVAEDERTLTFQTVNDKLRLDKTDIEQRERSPLSLMPEGLLEKLSPLEIRDLFAYLMGADQVELPAEPSAVAGSPDP
jgi:putative heme-binding domain-containing protein